MADQPPEFLRGRLTVLAERYRTLTTEYPALATSLRALEEAIRHDGSPTILHEQLAIAQDWGEYQRTEKREDPPRLLLLPVGYSPDALLLAVAYHAPAAVVLLVAETLDPAYLHGLESLWNRERDLLGGHELSQVIRREVRDDPPGVFSAVREIVREHPDVPAARIVLDLTGGKKSITAGAFLAAVHLRIGVSYVDFADYDPVLRRPGVGSIQPGRLTDPAQLFRLREEDQLIAAFDAGAYEEAERLASELAAAAADRQVEAVLGRTDAEARRARFALIGEVARGYRLWGEGFYRDAGVALEAVPGLPVAPTLAVLGEVWPSRKATHQEIVAALDESVIFARPAVALAYFVDVLAWWNMRRIEVRPRDAYVRLYGTVESLLSFLVHAHVARHPERLTISGLGTELGSVLDVCYASSRKAEALLRGKPLEAGDATACLSPPAIPREAAKRLFDGRGVDTPYWHRFIKLRHKTTHWLAPVPVDLARQLRSFLCSVVLELVPPAVEDLIAAGVEPAELSSWVERLGAAAKGPPPEDCCPLTEQEIEERVLAFGSPVPRAVRGGVQ